MSEKRLSDAEYARKLTQYDPLEIPRVDGSFFAEVKVDHEGVFRPNPSDYLYQEVKKVFDSKMGSIGALLDALKPYCDDGKINNISDERRNEIDPYWNNHMFEAYDARMLYAMLAYLKPQKVIEVGSGHSSKFMRRSISDHGLKTHITSIDPYPRDEISKVSDKVIYQSVFDVPVETFDQLEGGDILFWDGSHIVFNGTDTTHLMMNIIPRLNKGVYLHIHDIQLPFEYDRGYSAHYYNEQYMVAMLVLHSQKWEPILPLQYIGRCHAEKYLGRSIWFHKVAD